MSDYRRREDRSEFMTPKRCNSEVKVVLSWSSSESETIIAKIDSNSSTPFYTYVSWWAEAT